MHGGYFAAMRAQCQKSRAQRRLQRADVKDHARRTAQRKIAQYRVRHAERRRKHDEILLQIGLASASTQTTLIYARRICHFDRKALRA